MPARLDELQRRLVEQREPLLFSMLTSIGRPPASTWMRSSDRAFECALHARRG
jgi:hypothetical protein